MRARELGGNYVRIDRIRTRFESRLRMLGTSTCGSMRFPVTCGASSVHPQEVAIVAVSGRAFRVPEPAP